MPGMYENQPPVSMGSAYNPLEILKRLGSMFGGGPQDIELPNESGMVDDRIPQTGEALMNAFRQANKYAGERAGGTGAVDALRSLGGK